MSNGLAVQDLFFKPHWHHSDCRSLVEEKLEAHYKETNDVNKVVIRVADSTAVQYEHEGGTARC
jgi:hypothetical protein